MRKNQEIVERDEYYAEPGVSHMEKLKLYVIIGIVGSIASIAPIAFIVWLAHLFPVIKYAYIVSIATLPIIGVSFLGIKLWKYIRSVQVIAIAEKGNIIRLPDGNTQVISTEEVYAYETKDRLHPKAIQLPSIVNEELYYQNKYANGTSGVIPFPEPFPEGNDYPTVSILETDAETVMETLRQEQEAAKVELANKEREVIKQRIQQLHNINLSLRSISSIVHMQGRRYNEFKDLCRELGINTD